MNDPTTTGWQDDLLDRELVLTRLVDAPRELLFSLWTDPDHLPKWFGPEGFSIETREIDITVGGSWCFDMVAPDGRTVVTLRQLHPSAEQRDAVLGINAVELGYQTLDKMAAYGASLKG